jgi:hypothetical protein
MIRVTRFFAYWAIVYFGQFYENFRSSANINFGKEWVWLNFGEFCFTFFTLAVIKKTNKIKYLLMFEWLLSHAEA